jgi:hypothetical protein
MVGFNSKKNEKTNARSAVNAGEFAPRKKDAPSFIYTGNKSYERHSATR